GAAPPRPGAARAWAPAGGGRASGRRPSEARAPPVRPAMRAKPTSGARSASASIRRKRPIIHPARADRQNHAHASREGSDGPHWGKGGRLAARVILVVGGSPEDGRWLEDALRPSGLPVASCPIEEALAVA